MVTPNSGPKSKVSAKNHEFPLILTLLRGTAVLPADYCELSSTLQPDTTTRVRIQADRTSGSNACGNGGAYWKETQSILVKAATIKKKSKFEREKWTP